MTERETSPGALGESEIFLDFQEKLSKVAPVNRSVLLIGERGTGKELAASKIHYLSERWNKPYITLNCAALNSSLIESELFGYEKGAFTGATTSKKGRFETADGGTLFLDEIGNIPMNTQEKILRVVEYGTFERVGSSSETECDVRIVAATNANLLKASKEGKFMRDLLDRLSFEVLFVPPLRERKSDILLLASYFATAMAHELGLTETPSFTDEVETRLLSHRWNGNVRELKNTVERAVYRSENGIIDEIIFNPFLNPYEKKDGEEDIKNRGKNNENIRKDLIIKKGMNFNDAVDSFKAELIRETLERNSFNQKKASVDLGISYDKFRGIYRKYRDKITSTED